MQVQTEHYRAVLRAFAAWQRLMGYADRNATGAAEFLSRLECEGVRTLAEVGTAHVKAHYAYLQTRPGRDGAALSPHTVQGYLCNIRLLLRWAESSGRIAISPLAAMRFPTPPKAERAVLSKAEIRVLYAACDEPVERLTLSLYYGCGLRASEGARLNLDDVDAAARLLYVRRGKGRKRRVIPLTDGIVSDIETYVHEQRPTRIGRRTRPDDRRALALNKIGTRMQAGSYRKVFKQVLSRRETIRQDVSLHSLRHSIATHLLADGMRIERVRDFLGHDCLETTQIYTRVNLQRL